VDRAPLPLLPSRPVDFPDPHQARDVPDGLLAAGGALSAEWLIEAYAVGVFPWFDPEDEYILWWSPSQRAVLIPGQMRITRSLRKRARNGNFKVSTDQAFDRVIAACAGPRRDAQGTWITPDMIEAYSTLHALGYAHSVEIWHEDTLVGGLYGLALGRMFFGESMFSRVPDASKIAFMHLQYALLESGFELIDCQMMNPHLQSLGVAEVPRAQFLEALRQNPRAPSEHNIWRLAPRSITLPTTEEG